MTALLLSIFPGIDLLGMAFEAEWPEACVVRGPDPIFGGDIRAFHPPSGCWDGCFGGPPCQSFSALVHLIRANGHEPRFGNLIPEFERVVEEALPRWFLMENVPAAPVPTCRGYHPTTTLLLNNRWVGAEQNRLRRFCFGMRLDLEPRALDVSPDLVALEQPIEMVAVISGNGFGNGADYYARTGQAVLGGERSVPVKIGGSGKLKKTHVMVRYSIAEAARLQGLPEDFLADAPFTKDGKLKAIANGVPLPMGRAIAAAVKRSMEGGR